MASIHPAVHGAHTRAPYFKACLEARTDIKLQLSEAFSLREFDLYLLPSTSAALTTLLLSSYQAGLACALRGGRSQHYAPFLSLFSGSPTSKAALSFRTHVSPITGAVDELPDPETTIVDGAQSFGTCLTESLVHGSRIAIAPLHKHLGLAAGLALSMISRRSPVADTFRRTLDVVEAGSPSLTVLRQAQARLSQLAGRVSNRATLNVDESFRSTLERLGLRVLGASGPPFACITTLDGSDIEEKLNPGAWRLIKEANVARFSFDRRGAPPEPPVDFSKELLQTIRHLLQR